MASRLAEIDLSEWFLLVGMLGVITFTFLYGLRSRWWKYIEGIALFAKSLTLAAVSSLSVAYLFFGEYPYRQEVRLVVYALFCASSWFFVVALVRRQTNEGRTRRRLEKELAEARRREGKPPAFQERRSVMEAFEDWRKRDKG